MIPLGKQIQTSLRLISVSLSNALYCIYDVSVVSRCTLYLNKILFALRDVTHSNDRVISQFREGFIFAICNLMSLYSPADFGQILGGPGT